jgi:hypothetical protein
VFGVAFVFTPSIVPTADDTVYLVEDYLGRSGRIFPETSVAKSDRETILRDLYASQYHDPVRVVAFNTREGWSRDVSYEFAVEIQRRADLTREELSGNLAEFVRFYTRPAKQLTLRLA